MYKVKKEAAHRKDAKREEDRLFKKKIVSQ